jgi:hypothetical protein
MSDYEKIVRDIISECGHSERACEALCGAEVNLVGSADGFDALKAYGIAAGEPQSDTTVYKRVSFKHVMKRDRHYSYRAETVLFFQDGVIHYCGIRKARFNPTVEVADSSYHARLLEAERGEGEEVITPRARRVQV